MKHLIFFFIRSGIPFYVKLNSANDRFLEKNIYISKQKIKKQTNYRF